MSEEMAAEIDIAREMEMVGEHSEMDVLGDTGIPEMETLQSANCDVYNVDINTVVKSMEHHVRVAGCHITFTINVESLHIKKQNCEIPREIFIDMSNALLLLDILGYNKEDIDLDASMYNIDSQVTESGDTETVDTGTDLAMTYAKQKVRQLGRRAKVSRSKKLKLQSDKKIKKEMTETEDNIDVALDPEQAEQAQDEEHLLELAKPKKQTKAQKIKLASVKKSKSRGESKIGRPKKRKLQVKKIKKEVTETVGTFNLSDVELLEQALAAEDDDWVVPENVKGKKRKRIKTRTRPAKTTRGPDAPLYMCDVCGYTTPYSSLIPVHMRVHSGEKPFKCNICDASFAQSGALHGHHRTHTGERPYICAICGHTFVRKDGLNRHMFAHTGAKPHLCKECGARFARPRSLREHMNIHLGLKAYQCSFCELRFTQKGNLTQHIKMHTGEKAYLCTTCGASFAHSGHLKNHKRIHTGEKPYSCTECTYTCAESGNLKKHMRTHVRLDNTPTVSVGLDITPKVEVGGVFGLFNLTM